jgi:ATP-dependent DNA ligase
MTLTPRSERRREKTKCEQTDTVAAIGFNQDDRGRIDGVLLGPVASGQLVYAGTVEHGFTADDIGALEERLRLLQVKRCPLRLRTSAK